MAERTLRERCIEALGDYFDDADKRDSATTQKPSTPFLVSSPNTPTSGCDRCREKD